MVWGVQPYMRLLTRVLWLANNSLYVFLYINDILLDGQIFAVMVDKILRLKVFILRVVKDPKKLLMFARKWILVSV